MNGPPILVTGADRSGTTLLYTLLASHPDVMMVRRTNLWRWFDGEFGDLSNPANLDRCIDEMMRYKRLDVLDIRPEQVLGAFRSAEPTYGRLFEVMFRQAAERRGRSRWGDKSLHTELHADRVLEAWPTARIVQLVRDPRDRYASVVGRRGPGHNSAASIMGRWLKSVRAGERQARRHPDSFMMLKFEDLVLETESRLREVCEFLELEYDERMFEMGGGDDRASEGANSSFDSIPRGSISRRPIGRYREHLDEGTVARIQGVARRPMARWGYAPDEFDSSLVQKAVATGIEAPIALAQATAWRGLELVREFRGRSVPEERLRDRS